MFIQVLDNTFYVDKVPGFWLRVLWQRLRAQRCGEAVIEVGRAQDVETASGKSPYNPGTRSR
jgi:hypothetical protein